MNQEKIPSSWTDLEDSFDDFLTGDMVYIDPSYTEGDNIKAITQEEELLLTLTPETIKLMREKNYLKKCKDFGSKAKNFNFKDSENMVNDKFPKMTWNNSSFKKIFNSDISIGKAAQIKVSMTNLLQLVLLANNKNRSGWNPAKFYIHEKSGKSYREFREKYKSLS
ncbi:MAG: hypothetical protein ACOC44_18565 [Promethearchaeia archaeon]